MCILYPVARRTELCTASNEGSQNGNLLADAFGLVSSRIALVATLVPTVFLSKLSKVANGRAMVSTYST